MRIAVAGLGIGGSAVALALARRGHDVTVFEQAASPGPVGAGFLLQPSGQAMLAELGLLEPVAARAWPIREFRANRVGGRRLASLRYDRHGPDGYALGVERGELFDVLVEAATRAGVHVVAGTRVTRARMDRATVEPGTDDGPLGAFDLLVAADGARSVLRTVIDPGATTHMSPHAALWGVGTVDGPNEHRLWQEARGTRILAGLLPVAADRTAFFCAIRADRVPALMAGDFETFLADACAVHPAAEPVVRSIGSFDGLLLARYALASMRRTFRGRMVAIGDAAHATTPHLGQGANLALLDAAALVDALEGDGQLEARLATYDRRRRWQSRRYAFLSQCLSPFFQSELAWLGPPRDLGLPILSAIPPIRAIMERVLAGDG